MPSPSDTPLPRRRIAPLPRRPRSVSGQHARSSSASYSSGLSPESSIGTAPPRQHSLHRPSASADARHLSPAAEAPGLAFQFGQTNRNLQPIEQHETFTFRVLHNVTPRPSPEPEETASFRSAQALPVVSAPSSSPTLPAQEDRYLQPLRSGERNALDRSCDTLEPVNSSETSSDLTTSRGLGSASRSTPSLSVTLASEFRPSPSTHSHRISDISIISETDSDAASYDVRDEETPPEPYFTSAFQSAIQKGLDIAKSVAAAMEKVASTLDPDGDLERLLNNAKTLSVFHSSDTRTVAILGDSGQGNVPIDAAQEKEWLMEQREE